MRAMSLVFVAALAAPAVADPAQKEPEVVVKVEPPPKRDVKEASCDLVGALRNVGAHLDAWSADPVKVSMGMLLGPDTIAIVRLRFH